MDHDGPGGRRARWRFVMPDGTSRPWWDGATLARLLTEQVGRQTVAEQTAGERFDLDACVETLLTVRLPEDLPGERQEAA